MTPEEWLRCLENHAPLGWRTYECPLTHEADTHFAYCMGLATKGACDCKPAKVAGVKP